jgi:hypothetical protein
MLWHNACPVAVCFSWQCFLASVEGASGLHFLISKVEYLFIHMLVIFFLEEKNIQVYYVT